MAGKSARSGEEDPPASSSSLENTINLFLYFERPVSDPEELMKDSVNTDFARMYNLGLLYSEIPERANSDIKTYKHIRMDGEEVRDYVLPLPAEFDGDVVHIEDSDGEEADVTGVRVLYMGRRDLLCVSGKDVFSAHIEDDPIAYHGVVFKEVYRIQEMSMTNYGVHLALQPAPLEERKLVSQQYIAEELSTLQIKREGFTFSQAQFR